MLIRNKRVRSLGRVVPGLSTAYHFVLKQFVLRRGVARMDYAGANIKISATSGEIVHLRLRPLAKEPWTVEWLEQSVRDGDVFYDIGANVGNFALIAAAITGPATRVFAFEPAYPTYASLCENDQLNGFGDRIVPLPVVLGESARLGSLSYRDTQAGAAMHTLDAGGGAYDQPVLVFALDELIRGYDLPKPTLIKLDVDGAEAAVLAGAAETLRNPELRSLLVEVEDDQTDAVLHAVTGAGLALKRRIDDRYGEKLPGLWYGIFERE
jgi:FkbM family methyltransferase